MSKPLLTIGIIFKDNIRSIERCLSALQPLRDAAPCELVMADTGSADGSREVAERYADILFDFPWIDDFAAARNAVMDRASGKWFLTVDTDEYLDGDVTGLKAFLTQAGEGPEIATVVVRNYTTYEMDEKYTDFTAVRLLRMSTGMRYQGRIHETWKKQGGGKVSAGVCPGTILHHDGYVEVQDNPNAEKLQRNLALLREKVKDAPEDLLAWLQLVESSLNKPDIWDIIGRAMVLVEQKKSQWEWVGPPLVRHAVVRAGIQKRPDTEEWIARAETMFPNSLFTRVDVQFVICSRLWEEKNYAKYIERAEDYLQALEDYRAGKDSKGLMYSALVMASPSEELDIRLRLADAYVEEGRPEHSKALLERIEIGRLDTAQFGRFMIALRGLHAKSRLDTAPLITAAWDSVEISKDGERLGAFLQTGGAAFARENRETEVSAHDFCRPAYTMLLPLEGRCELGRAAAIMEGKDLGIMAEKLSQVERWEEFPIHALAFALEQGVPFPPADVAFRREELEMLAVRLSGDQEGIVALACRAADGGLPEDWPGLFWTLELILEAVRVFDWAADGADSEQGMALARIFAQVEGAFLPRYYTPAALEMLFILPPMHRFGWCCVQAFETLDGGNAVGYVRLLREGLTVCTGMKPLVEFLTKHTPELQAPPPSAELLTLAEQIRTILAAYSPNDPAVVALKQSEAYQMVKHLIENKTGKGYGTGIERKKMNPQKF